MPVFGMISLKVHLYPLSKLNIVPQKTVERELELEKKRREQLNNSFYSYANIFWN